MSLENFKKMSNLSISSFETKVEKDVIRDREKKEFPDYDMNQLTKKKQKICNSQEYKLVRIFK